MPVWQCTGVVVCQCGDVPGCRCDGVSVWPTVLTLLSLPCRNTRCFTSHDTITSKYIFSTNKKYSVCGVISPNNCWCRYAV